MNEGFVLLYSSHPCIYTHTSHPIVFPGPDKTELFQFQKTQPFICHTFSFSFNNKNDHSSIIASMKCFLHSSFWESFLPHLKCHLIQYTVVRNIAEVAWQAQSPEGALFYS